MTLVKPASPKELHSEVQAAFFDSERPKLGDGLSTEEMVDWILSRTVVDLKKSTCSTTLRAGGVA